MIFPRVFKEFACLDFRRHYLNKRGRPGSFPTCARPTRAFRGRALREHRELPGLPFFLFPPPFLFPYSPSLVSKGVAKVALDCAHRTRAFLGRAFCEQGGHRATPFPLLLLLLLPPYNDGSLV